MRRLIIPLALAALAASLVAAPASAATVRVVDGDGKGSASDCNSSAPAFKKIQKAVDAARAGDTVLVCPGTYVETVEVGASKDGLRIRSATHWGATLRIPTGESGAVGIHIKPGAERVRVVDLAIRYRTQAPLSTAGIERCGASAGILVEGTNARIIGNNIQATGESTLLCGLGIAVYVLGDTGPATASVDYNVIKDFAAGGIVAEGNASLAAFRNIVRYHHKNATVIESSARRSSGVRAGPAGRPARGLGIAAMFDARGIIRENTVEGSFPGRGPLSGGGRTFLQSGIMVTGDAEHIVSGNRTFRSFLNIGLEGEVGPAGSSGGADVEGNVAQSGYYGIAVGGTDARISGNQTSSNLVGIKAWEWSSGNQITGNDARYNYEVDCDDDTAGSAAEVANTWADNQALTDEPSGICIAFNP